MKLDELTIGEAKQLAALFASGTAQTVHPAVGKYVVIRTYSAGIHAGVLAAANGKEVTLTDSRRIWSWTGALSCSEIAMHGITGGKFGVAVDIQYITEAIEIIPARAEAEKCLRNFK